MRFDTGTVALVGAGPGDPGLITVRGADWLRQADVVIYDALSNPRLLRQAPDARHVYVGKRAANHALPQDQINTLLVSEARAGHRVVRLKGGDPFVFGRGGEEAETLVAAGVPFLVAPGITAAVAAAAYAGIPITHRDLNSSFTLITGHEKEEAYRDDAARARGQAEGSSDVDWPAIAKLPAVAFYMGIKALPRIAANLIENGMSADTPAATIQWGTLPRQRTVVATVGTIAQAVADAGVGSPAITLVGRVVALRQTLNWFENRPLFGKTVVVTRTRSEASALSELLESMGADVIEAPTIDVVPSTDFAGLDAALLDEAKPIRVAVPMGRAGAPPVMPYTTKPAGPHWLVFTSAAGVKAAAERMKTLKIDARRLAAAKIAVVGEATAEVVRSLLCIEPDCVPKQFVAEALADELIARGEVKGTRFSVLRADIARPVLVDKLRAAGAQRVDDIAVYETRPAAELPDELLHALDAGRVDWITFTSSSTAKNLCALLGPDYAMRLAGIGLASIGPVTTAVLTELGLTPTVQSDQADVAALAESLRSYSK